MAKEAIYFFRRISSMAPQISILLASYNHQDYITECIESIVSQNHENLELIVIDDGSTDNSPVILRNLQPRYGFKLICRENRGLIATYNELFSLSGGEYISTFASDDRMFEGRITRQIKYLESHPEMAAVCGLPCFIDNNGNNLPGAQERHHTTDREIFFEDIFTGKSSIHATTVMMRREVLEHFKGWDQRYAVEDFPLWLKMLSGGYRIHYSKTPFSYYRLHGKNLHCNVSFMFSEVLKILGDYKSHPLYKRAVRAYKTIWFSELAYTDKPQALKRFSHLAVPTLAFWLRVPKLFIPQRFLKW